jgi:DNA processing protein
MQSIEEQVIDLLALCRIKGASWHLIAREAQRPDGIRRLLAGEASEVGPDAERTLPLLRAAAPTLGDRRRWVVEVLGSTLADGYRLTTVLDDDYPVNLRLIPNLPPFLFYRGELRPEDAYSVAVVGTRRPSPEGLARADKVTRGLVDAEVTVLSGLARGIDTVAHRSCLEAGGRTIAVLGCGIRRMYPPENGPLADRIVAQGAIVSQFWPDAPPTRNSFAMRNVVTSGLGQGTVVIEATSTSGAKMQARLAFEHGKQVFLLQSLVTSQRWTQRLLGRPRVYEVRTIEDIVRRLRPIDVQRDRVRLNQQLALAL